MKATLTLEDTPDGLVARIVWQGNDTTDHPTDSVSMYLMGFFTEHIRTQSKLRLLRIHQHQA